VTALLWIAGIVAATAVFLSLVNRSGARMLAARRDAVAQLGKTLGLPSPPAEGPLGLDGTTRSGVVFRLETSRVQGQRGFRELLTMSARPRRALPTIVVRDRYRAGQDALAGLASIRVGDAAFDEAFTIHADREDEAKALLTPALRAEMLGGGAVLLQRAELLRVSSAEVSLSYVTITPGLFEPARLERIARRVLELCG
jgi:hypothetical protein